MIVSWEGEVLLCNEAKGGKHGGATVFDFGLAKPLHVEVIGKSEWVEFDVAYPSCGVGWCLDEWDGFGQCIECSG